MLTDLHYVLNNVKKDIYTIKNARIFITGATGFFGKWLLESFVFLNNELDLNIKLFSLSRNPEVFLKQFPYFEKENNIYWIKGDVRNFDFPKEQFDYIIHAATDADAKLNTENPLLMLDTITEGTKRVLEFAKKQNELKSCLFTSSGAVYGDQPSNVLQISETDSFYIDINNPNSAYAEGKRLSELYCSIYHSKYEIPIKIARCFAFVGPYLPLNKHFAIGNFIRDGFLGNNITIKGDGIPLRSYMYTSDLIIWLLTIMIKGKNCEAYNVGSDKPISIKELAYKVAEYFPEMSVEILNQTLPTDRNHNYVPNTSKVKNEFSINSEISIDEAISKTIQFYKSNSKNESS